MSMWHLVLLLLVLVLLFGTSKLRNMGGDLGAAIKGFKEGVKGDDDISDSKNQDKISDPKVIESASVATSTTQQPSEIK